MDSEVPSSDWQDITDNSDTYRDPTITRLRRYIDPAKVINLLNIEGESGRRSFVAMGFGSEYGSSMDALIDPARIYTKIARNPALLQSGDYVGMYGSMSLSQKDLAGRDLAWWPYAPPDGVEKILPNGFDSRGRFHRSPNGDGGDIAVTPWPIPLNISSDYSCNGQDPTTVHNHQGICPNYHFYEQFSPYAAAIARFQIIPASSSITITNQVPDQSLLNKQCPTASLIPYTVTPSTEGAGTSDGTITVTLPAGVSYADGSSVITQPTTPNGTIAFVSSAVDPATSKTLITYSVTGITIGQLPPAITFNGVLNCSYLAGNFTATTNIQLAADAYDPTNTGLTNLHSSSTTVSLTAPEGYLVRKSAVKPVVEVKQDLQYDLSFANTSTHQLNEVKIMDILPYNGDCNNTTGMAPIPTSSNGAATPQDPRILCTASHPSTPKTVDFSSITAAPGVDLSQFPPVYECSTQAVATLVDDPNSAANTWSSTCDATATAVRVTMTGTIPARSSTYTLRLTLKPTGLANLKDDLYINSFSSRVKDYKGTTVDLLSLSNDAQIKVVSGSIGDYVWADTNSNGIQDATESGIPGVTVNLLDSTGTVVATTTTDAAGAYLFTNLNSGNYTVKVVPPAGIKQTYDLDDGHQVSGVYPTPNSTLVALAPTLDPLTGVQTGVPDIVTADFGYTTYDLSLQKAVSNPAAKAGDVVTYTLTLHNDAASSVPIVSIADIVPTGLTNITSISNAGTLAANVPAGSTGTITWNLTGTDAAPIIAGGASITLTYQATVATAGGTGSSTGTPPASSNLAYRNTAQITKMTDGSGSPLYDTDSQVNNMNLAPNATLQDDEAATTLMPTGTATISGLVYQDVDFSKAYNSTPSGSNPADKLISGVTIQLLDATGNVLATTTTAADGTYSFTNLIAGNYYSVKEVQPSNYANEYTNPGTLSTDPNTTTNQSNQITAITLQDGSSSITNNFGESLAPISGFVYSDTAYNNTKDATDPAIAGVTVNLLDSTGAVVATTTTDATGAYSFPNIAPGSYTIQEIQPTGYYSTETPTNSIPVIHGLVAQPNNNFGEAKLYDLALVKTVSNPNAKAGDTVTYSITVTNQGPNAVSAFSTLDTIPNGLTNITNISNGGSFMPSTPAGNNNTTGTISWTINNAPSSSTPAINAGATLTLSYDATVATAGGTGSSTDPTAPAASSLFYRNIAQITAMQDLAGNPIKDVDSTPNNLTITDPSTTTLNPEDDESAAVLMPSGSAQISGLVYNDVNKDKTYSSTTDTPIAGVTVQLLDSKNVVLATTTTAADGTYSFTNLIAGNYSVKEIQPTTYANEYTNPGTLSADPNTTTNQSNQITAITLTDGSSSITNNFGESLAPISGFVYNDTASNNTRDATDPPLAGWVVTLLDSKGTVISTATTAADGSYSFPNVAPGDYTLQETQNPTYGSTETPTNTISLTHALVAQPNNNFGEAKLYDLALKKSVSDLNAKAGDKVTYTLTITNQGPNDVPSYSMADVIPNGLTNPTAISDAGALAPNAGSTATPATSTGTITWAALGPITAGSTKTITYQATVATAGGSLTALSYRNTAQITSMKDASGNNIKDTDSTPGNMSTNPSEDDEDAITLMPVGSATISGNVYQDVDKSKVMKSTSTPIPAVQVQLLDATGTVLLTTTTAADGSYSFKNLPAGIYQVKEIQPTTYANEYTNPGTLSTDPNTTTNQSNQITMITLTDGSSSISNNFGESQGKSSGKIVIPPATCVPTIDPTTLTANLIDSTGKIVSTAKLAADSSYSFGTIAPGTYTITITGLPNCVTLPSTTITVGTTDKTTDLTLIYTPTVIPKPPKTGALIQTSLILTALGAGAYLAYRNKMKKGRFGVKG